ncbi:MAG: formyltransferase family protein [Ekhidna sp.]|nr:formyltransferase family protein [Ekhidna sp.]
MKIIFLGCTKFSEDMLKDIKKNRKVEIRAIFSIPQKFKISYSKDLVENKNFADLSEYAKELSIPFIEINSIDGQRMEDNMEIIRSIKPDVILVLGWYYMVGSEIRNLAKYGAWGIHASLLPKYAGNAPLVWAIINGEREAGVSLFKLDSGVDDGDIIAQKKFEIADSDSIKQVYDKATKCSIEVLNKILKNPDKIKFKPQDKDQIEIYPQRKPDDGEINLKWDSQRMHNFIRAQSSPYPGAFIRTVDGKKLIIEKARIES